MVGVMRIRVAAPLLLLAALATPTGALADPPPVCALACDRLDPSQARQETFPVPDQHPGGRLLRLHVSDPDAMAWASVDSGQAGDQVWLDRSWDGGASWDGLLGIASIPSPRAGGRAGDEGWVDRSWDAGATWPDGSSLGRVSVPAGAAGVRTVLYNTRDPRGLLYGGAVRACGRAVEGQNGSCTAWARPAPAQ